MGISWDTMPGLAHGLHMGYAHRLPTLLPLSAILLSTGSKASSLANTTPLHMCAKYSMFSRIHTQQPGE